MSINSGRAIINACDELGYNVQGFDGFDESILNQKFDFIFLALHGTFGEDGSVQKILENHKTYYNGSNSLSSEHCFDKNFTKIITKENDILTPEWLLVDSKEDSRISDISFKPIVKPNKEGSTIGFSLIDDLNDLGVAIDKSLKHGQYALIEEYIEGREITVSVLGNKSLPVIEIKPHSNVYDYKSKYTKGGSDYVCPAEIDNSLSEQIKETALKVHNLLGCQVYSRVDFRLDKNDKFWLLEINTLPGMTETSLFPMAAKAVGLSFENLIDKIIKLSLEK
ncbi:MAG: D-alanine--D-alanine ligase [Candidatus Neomarinimicrobiota bacterium]|nr:D-alanine--D-alanine ligase [Candidatus Neomarinimicrobiota bacterium]MEC8946617.1 D-alanine--D-alanine ligase [Candidatus Neomarinimicrobiota bacterium]